MRVLFATTELYPFVKTGGLGDVCAALPQALLNIGVDVRLIMPAYPQLNQVVSNKQWLQTLHPPFATAEAQLYFGYLPSGVGIYLLDVPHFYARLGSPYLAPNGADWWDNYLRFALFSWAITQLEDFDWQPDVLHTHDWLTGLAPYWLLQQPEPRPKSLHTIHNLSFQGKLNMAQCAELGLPSNTVSFMQMALEYTDVITTVSPRYAEEIQTPAFGCDLDRLLEIRQDVLHGILNGVDYQVWSPDSDEHLTYMYNSHKLYQKNNNKMALQARLGLEVRADVPLCCMLTRMSWQKGLDLILPMLPEWIEKGWQFAIIGSGEHNLEQGFLSVAARYPKQIAAKIGYEEDEAHRFLAAADTIMVPSRFEPCGLTQLYGLRYGTLPIVSPVGGLYNTVSPVNYDNLRKGRATGFVLSEVSEHALRRTMSEVSALYADTVCWQAIQRNAMSQDFGWRRAARQYLQLYKELYKKEATLS